MIEITNETYQVLKTKQINTPKILRELKEEHKRLQKEGSSYGKIGELRKIKYEARLHNILYGFIRNKTYKQIETHTNKVYEIYLNGRYNYATNTIKLVYEKLITDLTTYAERYGIKDIDAICNLAKFIELNCTYDRNISEKDFKIILKEIIKLARKYKLEKIENYE